MQSLIPICIPSFLPSTSVKVEGHDGLKNGKIKTVGKDGLAGNACGIHWFYGFIQLRENDDVIASFA